MTNTYISSENPEEAENYSPLYDIDYSLKINKIEKANKMKTEVGNSKTAESRTEKNIFNSIFGGRHILKIILFLFFLLFSQDAFSRINLVWKRESPNNRDYNISKFSPNSKKIAIAYSYVNSSDTGATVLILDATNGDSLMELRGHKGRGISSMTWLTDSTLASGDGNSDYGHKRTFRVWNVNTGENLITLLDSDTLYPWHKSVCEILSLKSRNKLYIQLFTQRRETINSSPPFRYFYYSDTILVYNATTYEFIKPLNFSDSGEYHYLNLILKAPDDSFYCVVDYGNSQLRNPDDDSIIWQNDSTNHFGFNLISLNSKFGVIGGGEAVRVYDIENKQFENTFQFDSLKSIINTLISPDSRYIALIGNPEDNQAGYGERFGVFEIDNPSNFTFQDSIICGTSFEASNDSLYILCSDDSNIWVYTAPWSPLNSIVDEENVEESILYPNPNDGKVIIEGGIIYRNLRNIDVMNLNGKIIKTLGINEITQNAKSIEINTGDLPQGIYLINLNSGKKNNNHIFKLIKK